MTMGTPSTVRVGMCVVGSDRDEVGTVKAVRAADFLVDRRMRRDVYVPMAAVRDVTADSIMLDVPAGRVDDQHWPSPPLTGGERPAAATPAPAPAGAYHCPVCGADFASAAALADHRRAAHLM
ncbi:MAG TPA: DUF2171 domain-containing protein [Thermomicrobiales bacterium]|nr:DUF2171 domain-containing protein [Thermomicrobiales bacterium]